MGKPPVTPCRHQTQGRGCGIYETRPETCRKFECLWLYDREGKHFDPADRPDKGGVLVVPSGPSRFSEETRIQTLVAFEVRPGAFESYWGRKLLTRLKKKIPLILVEHGGVKDGARKLIGPPALVRKAHEWLTHMTR